MAVLIFKLKFENIIIPLESFQTLHNVSMKYAIRIFPIRCDFKKLSVACVLTILLKEGEGSLPSELMRYTNKMESRVKSPIRINS